MLKFPQLDRAQLLTYIIGGLGLLRLFAELDDIRDAFRHIGELDELWITMERMTPETEAAVEFGKRRASEIMSEIGDADNN